LREPIIYALFADPENQKKPIHFSTEPRKGFQAVRLDHNLIKEMARIKKDAKHMGYKKRPEEIEHKALNIRWKGKGFYFLENNTAKRWDEILLPEWEKRTKRTLMEYFGLDYKEMIQKLLLNPIYLTSLREECGSFEEYLEEKAKIFMLLGIAEKMEDPALPPPEYGFLRKILKKKLQGYLEMDIP